MEFAFDCATTFGIDRKLRQKKRRPDAIAEAVTRAG
jgi:hypothetical protein